MTLSINEADEDLSADKLVPDQIHVVDQGMDEDLLPTSARR